MDEPLSSATRKAVDDLVRLVLTSGDDLEHSFTDLANTKELRRCLLDPTSADARYYRRELERLRTPASSASASGAGSTPIADTSRRASSSPTATAGGTDASRRAARHRSSDPSPSSAAAASTGSGSGKTARSSSSSAAPPSAPAVSSSMPSSSSAAAAAAAHTSWHSRAEGVYAQMSPKERRYLFEMILARGTGDESYRHAHRIPDPISPLSKTGAPDYPPAPVFSSRSASHEHISSGESHRNSSQRLPSHHQQHQQRPPHAATHTLPRHSSSHSHRAADSSSSHSSSRRRAHHQRHSSLPDHEALSSLRYPASSSTAATGSVNSTSSRRRSHHQSHQPQHFASGSSSPHRGGTPAAASLASSSRKRSRAELDHMGGDEHRGAPASSSSLSSAYHQSFLPSSFRGHLPSVSRPHAHSYSNQQSHDYASNHRARADSSSSGISSHYSSPTAHPVDAQRHSRTGLPSGMSYPLRASTGRGSPEFVYHTTSASRQRNVGRSASTSSVPMPMEGVEAPSSSGGVRQSKRRKSIRENSLTPGFGRGESLPKIDEEGRTSKLFRKMKMESEAREGSSCHQCKTKRPKELLIACGSPKGCRLKYCINCLDKWHPAYRTELEGTGTASPASASWLCLSCRGICQCAACSRPASSPSPAPAASPSVSPSLSTSSVPVIPMGSSGGGGVMPALPASYGRASGSVERLRNLRPRTCSEPVRSSFSSTPRRRVVTDPSHGGDFSSGTGRSSGRGSSKRPPGFRRAATSSHRPTFSQVAESRGEGGGGKRRSSSSTRGGGSGHSTSAQYLRRQSSGLSSSPPLPRHMSPSSSPLPRRVSPSSSAAFARRQSQVSSTAPIAADAEDTGGGSEMVDDEEPQRRSPSSSLRVSSPPAAPPTSIPTRNSSFVRSRTSASGGGTSSPSPPAAAGAGGGDALTELANAAAIAAADAASKAANQRKPDDEPANQRKLADDGGASTAANQRKLADSSATKAVNERKLADAVRAEVMLRSGDASAATVDNACSEFQKRLSRELLMKDEEIFSKTLPDGFFRQVARDYAKAVEEQQVRIQQQQQLPPPTFIPPPQLPPLPHFPTPLMPPAVHLIHPPPPLPSPLPPTSSSASPPALRRNASASPRPLTPLAVTGSTAPGVSSARSSSASSPSIASGGLDVPMEHASDVVLKSEHDADGADRKFSVSPIACRLRPRTTPTPRNGAPSPTPTGGASF